jgi:hypothetical protein
VRGTHFVTLADDDVWTPHTLEIVARVFEENPGMESLGVGLSHFDHDASQPVSTHAFLASFTGVLQRYDARRMGLSFCSSWGIGEKIQDNLPRLSHVSATFLGRDLVDRTAAKQGGLYIKPFGDVGYIGCLFNTDNSYYLDLPLAVIGSTQQREMQGSQSGQRMKWEREVPFLEHSPIKGCSFVNMGMDGHMKVLHRNGIQRGWDCSLRPDFFIRHLEHVASDRPWTETTERDIQEALPLAVEALMKQHNLAGDAARAEVTGQVLQYI